MATAESPAGRLPGGSFQDFEHAGGIHLSESILWCDANRRSGLNFLSSANAGEIGKHRRFLCTEATSVLAARGKGKLDVLVAPYGKIFKVGELELQLEPSGHMLGGAQLVIRREGRVVVYAGDLSVRPSATAVTGAPVPCDVLAVPATYAGRGLRFPPRAEVLESLRTFVTATLENRQNPLLLASPLDVGPELAVVLGRAGFKLKVHRQIVDILKTYAQLGVHAPTIKRLGKTMMRGDVLIAPPILRTQLETLGDLRTAIVGPRAVDAAYVHQARVAHAFPLSNVADGVELREFVLATGASEVFLTGGATGDFGATLRADGLIVRDLRPREQLELF